MKTLTAQYSRKIHEERAHFKKKVNTNELPPSHHYWSNKYLLRKIRSFGFYDSNKLFLSYILRGRLDVRKHYRFLSLGTGEAEFETGLAAELLRQGKQNFTFTCVDISRPMIKKAKRRAKAAGVAEHLTFVNGDLNTWQPDSEFDFVTATHSLHHLVELEAVFERVFEALHPDGYFIIQDMIGRNGHRRWPEAENFMSVLWNMLAQRHKYNHQLQQEWTDFINYDCSAVGFEGIRAQDILPLLVKKFHFEFFLGFSNLITLFTDRGIGPNFDMNCEWDRNFIDRVTNLDDECIEAGIIKPTQMIAILSKRFDADRRFYKHLSPEFCVRETSGHNGKRER